MAARGGEPPAGLTIQLASDFDSKQIVNGRLVAGSKLEIDFSTADMQQVSVQSGTFQSESGMAGTLTLQKDPTDISKLAVKLDIKGADQRLRANYNYGTVNPAYKSSDHLNVSVTDGAVMDGDLTELFNYFQTGVHQFAFGIPATDPEEPKEGVAALTTGSYAVHINVAQANLGKTFDLATNKELGLFVYDYGTYKTYDASKMGVTGTVRVIDAGSNNYYLSVDAVFEEGPTVKAEWFGSVTTEDSAFSEILTPVEPFRPKIQVCRPDGSTIIDWTIANVQVRHDPNYSFGGGGVKTSAYIFYFVKEDVSYVDSPMNVPFLAVNDDNLSCNIANMKDKADLEWQFKFTYQSGETLLYKGTGDYGHPVPYNTERTPDESSLSIQKDGTQWKITFQMKDWGVLQNGSPNPTGTNNTLVIQWEGPLTKYSGYNKNDLEDSFYGN